MMVMLKGLQWMESIGTSTYQLGSVSVLQIIETIFYDTRYIYIIQPLLVHFFINCVGDIASPFCVHKKQLNEGISL